MSSETENLRRQGAPWQQSVNAAVAEFLGETCPTVMIMNYVGTEAIDTRNIEIMAIHGQIVPMFTEVSDDVDMFRRDANYWAYLWRVVLWLQIMHGELDMSKSFVTLLFGADRSSNWQAFISVERFEMLKRLVVGLYSMISTT